MAAPSLNVLQDLWSSTPLDDPSLAASEWSTGSGLYVNLLVFIAFRFIFTAASLALPLPGGLLIPTMVIGASVGRLIGELMGLGAVSVRFRAGDSSTHWSHVRVRLHFRTVWGRCVCRGGRGRLLRRCHAESLAHHHCL